jgi:transmembrane 9 superfamily protein 2/4
LGTGLQLLLTFSAVILLAFLGFLNPSYAGGMISTALFCYMFMGIVSGYHSSRLFKSFRGNSWRRNAFFTAITVPALVFLAILFANFFLWGEGSSRAIPFSTLLALTAMWIGISLPLVYIGAYMGFKKPPYDNPCRTNQIPRLIPEQQWINKSFVR